MLAELKASSLAQVTVRHFPAMCKPRGFSTPIRNVEPVELVKCREHGGGGGSNKGLLIGV